MNLTKNTIAIIILSGLLFLGAEPCSAQLTTPKTFSVRIKQGANAWVPIVVDSILQQYTYGHRLTAEPQFAKFESDGVDTVEVTVNYTVNSFKLKPMKPIIGVTQNGNKFTFVMNKNTHQLCLELNGDNLKPFLIFKNPVSKNAPAASSPGVQYFGPGYTKIAGDGSIKPTGVGTTANPEIIFFDKNAIVEGHLVINKSNVLVKGTGLVYNPKITGSNYQCIMVSNCTNVRIEGITCVSRTDNWSFVTSASDHVYIDNLKLISEIRDGFDPLNSQNITIKHSFIMSHDDSFCPKGMAWGNNPEPVENILMDSCIIANMGGGNGIGNNGESVTPYFKNITFSNIDIIYCLGGNSPNITIICAAITIHPSRVSGFSDPRYTGDMPPIENYIFRNIRIESCEDDCYIKIGHDSPGDGIRNVILENISIEDSPARPVKIIAMDTNPIDSVSFINLTILGKPINSAADGNITITKATHVTFKTLATSIDLTPAQKICPSLSRSVAGKVFDVRGVYIGNYNSDQGLIHVSHSLPAGFSIAVPEHGQRTMATKSAIITRKK